MYNMLLQIVLFCAQLHFYIVLYCCHVYNLVNALSMHMACVPFTYMEVH